MLVVEVVSRDVDFDAWRALLGLRLEAGSTEEPNAIRGGGSKHVLVAAMAWQCRTLMLCLKMRRMILRALLRLRVVACSSHELSATVRVGSTKFLLGTGGKLHLLNCDDLLGNAAYDVVGRY